MSDEKPRHRVQAVMSDQRATWTTDSFQNFAARLGIGAGNLSSGSRYAFSYLTRQRQYLEAAYRTSWVVGAAIDIPADDMTKGGIEITGTLKADQQESLQAALNDLQIWQKMADGIRWGRLFGGAIVVLLIDGDDLARPLDVSKVRPGSFKGLAVLDRWQVQVDVTNLVTDLGPHLGTPKFYEVLASNTIAVGKKIHYSRICRFGGVKLPYYQSLYENLWDESVIERIFDRLVAFDSTSQGTAQLLYKAHLRTLKIPKLRELIAAGGKMLDAVTKQFELIRQFQSFEGLTVLDGEDEFQVDAYTFTGLDKLLTSFGGQLCGAVEIPQVRFFGQSPAGMNSSGTSDLQNYYDATTKKQGTFLRGPVTLIMDVLSRSVLSAELPAGFGFKFRSLWEMTDLEKSEIARNDTESVATAFDKGVVGRQDALRELRAGADVSGRWAGITDETINAAEEEPPSADELLGDPETGGGGKPGAKPAKPGEGEGVGTGDELPLRIVR